MRRVDMRQQRSQHELRIGIARRERRDQSHLDARSIDLVISEEKRAPEANTSGRALQRA